MTPYWARSHRDAMNLALEYLLDKAFFPSGEVRQAVLDIPEFSGRDVKVVGNFFQDFKSRIGNFALYGTDPGHGQTDFSAISVGDIPAFALPNFNSLAKR